MTVAMATRIKLRRFMAVFPVESGRRASAGRALPGKVGIVTRRRPTVQRGPDSGQLDSKVDSRRLDRVGFRVVSGATGFASAGKRKAMAKPVAPENGAIADLRMPPGFGSGPDHPHHP